MKKNWVIRVLAVMNAMSASASLIEFTSGEGYVGGGLNGQNGWTAAAGINVETNGAGKLMVDSSVDLGRATLDAGLSSLNTNYTFKSIMSFTRDSSSTEYRGFYFSEFAVGSDVIRVSITRSNASDQYQFGLGTVGGTGSKSSGLIAGSRLGLGATDNVSDKIGLYLALNHEVGSTNWLVSATFKNEDTVDTFQVWTDQVFTQTSGFSTGELMPQLMVGRSGSGYDIEVHSVEYTAIPEPETVGLFLLSSGVLFLARR